MTVDPLGIGGLLTDAGRIAQLMARGTFEDGQLFERTLEAALDGLRQYARSGERLQPASHRLAFRELGLAMGFNAARIAAEATHGRLQARSQACLEEIFRFAPLGTALRDFWVAPEHRLNATWRSHQDINDVMLATCLAPAGYLVLTPLRG